MAPDVTAVSENDARRLCFFTGATSLELIERGARENAGWVAVAFGDENQTFAQVNARANQFAYSFAALGVRPHTRVALLVNNGLLSVPLDFGCVKAGINRVPRLSAQEHVRMLQDSQSSILIFGADLADRARQLKAALPELRCFGLGVQIASSDDFLAIAVRQHDDAPTITVQPDDINLPNGVHAPLGLADPGSCV